MATDAIEYWIDVHRRIELAIEQLGGVEAEFARLCGISTSTLNSFMLEDGARAMTNRTWRKVRPVLDRLAPVGDSPAVETNPAKRLYLASTQSDHIIPVLDLESFDFNAEGEAMDQRIEDEARYHVDMPGARRGRDVLLQTRDVIRLRRGLILPTDLLLVNRQKKPKPGAVVVLSIGARGYIADVEAIDGRVGFVLPDGERPADARVFGCVKYHLEDWEPD